MPKCCACNSSGSCKFCVCVRSNRRCSNCSPSQHSRCENTALSGTTRTARITSSLGKPSRVTSTSKPSKRCSLSLRSVSSSRSSSPLASSCPPSLVASNAEKAGASAAGDQNAGVVGENSALSGELPGFNGSQPLRTSPTSFTTMVGDGQRQENSAPVAPVELVAPVAPVSTPPSLREKIAYQPNLMKDELLLHRMEIHARPPCLHLHLYLRPIFNGGVNRAMNFHALSEQLTRKRCIGGETSS